MLGDEEEREAHYKNEIFRMREDIEAHGMEKATLIQASKILEARLEQEKQEVARLTAEINILTTEAHVLRKRDDDLAKERSRVNSQSSSNVFKEFSHFLYDRYDKLATHDIPHVATRARLLADEAKSHVQHLAQKMMVHHDTGMGYIVGIAHSIQAYSNAEGRRNVYEFVVQAFDRGLQKLVGQLPRFHKSTVHHLRHFQSGRGLTQASYGFGLVC
eukprot:CAMPEP_0176171110 /NCGR_PEP_ID=MMETSP0120_2-20121206/87594_1 /TAXON_ID=160619 /ORGANISM="Kryptoperidinium foliaceum, Strain CCMP 1326" /LENGTH=215 /DNA_ID=CAMNT_0017508921 /DNA_START=202 /DNA_END=849 /DNA_ORIENTATION=+